MDGHLRSMIAVNIPKGHNHSILHHYHDLLTDITATVGKPQQNYQQTNIPLPNIISYLTQKRTYPFVPTPPQLQIPRIPISHLYERMRDKENLLLKSIQNSFAQKLLIKDSKPFIVVTAATYTTATDLAKDDSCFYKTLNTGTPEGGAAASKLVPELTTLRKLFHFSLTTKSAIVETNGQEHNLAIAIDNDNLDEEKTDVTANAAASSHMLTTTTTTNKACNSKTESPSAAELEDFTKNHKIDDIKMEQQQQHTKMTAKESISKMSLNLNGTTTNAGNGKSNLKKTVVTPKTPKTPLELTAALVKSSTPTTAAGGKRDKLQTAATVSFETKLTPKTPPVTPDSPFTYIEDDMNSVYSFATTTSGRSTMSCEHPYVALNGTTFSGRKMKYVVHCSAHAGQVGPDYLTPTQRVQRQLRRLKEVLTQARQDLDKKDSEIAGLTREVVELRLFKASLSSPDERSASSDAITVREAELKTSQDVSPIIDMVDDVGGKTSASPRHMHATQQSPHSLMHSSTEMQSSCADSGNFEDMTSSATHDIACGSDDLGASGDSLACSIAEKFEMQRQELIRMYEQKIEELVRSQDAASSEVKRVNNDKMEALLMKLAECNTRYADIVPDYEHAKERIRELEGQLEDLQHKLAEHEDKQKKMYLHMYQKGQEAERINRADQALEMAKRIPNSKVSVNELLLQLQNTQDELENIRASEQCRVECGNNHALLTAKEAISLWVVGARKTIYKRLLEAQKNRTHVDPEVTLQFLKSAIYYFLTDRENSQGHLQAIESILEFTEAEKQNIKKAGLMK